MQTSAKSRGPLKSVECRMRVLWFCGAEREEFCSHGHPHIHTVLCSCNVEEGWTLAAKLWISGRGTLAVQERLGDTSQNVLERSSQKPISASLWGLNIVNCSSFQRSSDSHVLLTLQSVSSEWDSSWQDNKQRVFSPLIFVVLHEGQSHTAHTARVIKYFDMEDICHGDEREAPTGGSQSAPQRCFHCWSFFHPSPDLVPHRCPCVTRASLHPDSKWGSGDILQQTAVHHWS